VEMTVPLTTRSVTGCTSTKDPSHRHSHSAATVGLARASNNRAGRTVHRMTLLQGAGGIHGEIGEDAIAAGELERQQ
jgi:hypothetical protein